MKEKLYQGIGISPGIAIGKAFIMEMAEPVIWMHRIKEEYLGEELKRFERALAATREALLKIKNRIGREMGSEHAYIFDAHLQMLEDPMLTENVTGFIKEKKVNAEFALQHVTNELSMTFSAFEDAYLRDRGVDVLDIGNRIQWHLSRPVETLDNAPAEPSILLSHDIHPSKLASMDSSIILGIAMDVGGQTTHTGLLASAKNIPAVVGLRDLSVIVRPGEMIILDGSDGVVITNPSKKMLGKYTQKQKLFQQREEELLTTRDLPAVTQDGIEITLLANIELHEEVEPAFNKFGAQGVGLYRSEYIFLSNPTTMPTEKDHEQIYLSMAEKVGDKTINLRTLDLGGEKGLASLEISPEPNPALGLRAVRFGLKKKSIFKAQLRGILRASLKGNIRIMVPMISGIEEIRQVKDLLEQCKLELMKENVDFNRDIQLGIMIEVPSAAIVADVLAKEVDFVSVGTNDLIQYVLAIDRSNESVAHLYEPFHPAVLRLLLQLADKVNAVGTQLSMCGEMAADPIATPLLIGMGFHELSMNPLSIPVIKMIIRSIRADMCRDITKEALSLPSVDKIYEFLRQKLEHYYPQIQNVKLGIPLGELHR